MDCPYCYSSIHEDASICPHCRSDLGVIKPLLKRIAALEAQVSVLSSEVKNPTTSVVEPSPNTSSWVASSSSTDTSPASLSEEWFDLRWQRLVTGVLTTALGLIFLHWLLLFIYDTRPLFLRVVTLLVPMLTGFVILRRHVVSLVALALGSTGLGALAVSGMLYVTGYLDGVAVWPTTHREWREVIEYGMGIALGFFSAGLLVRFQHDLSISRAQEQARRGRWFFLERNPDGTVKAAKFAMEVSKFLNAAAPVASGATALYAGLKSVLGN